MSPRRNESTGRHRRLPWGWGRPLIGSSIAVVALALATVTVLVATGDPGDRRPAADGTRTASTPTSAHPRTSSDAAPSTPLQVPVPAPSAAAAPGIPVLVSVPRIHVSSRLEPLALEKDGSLSPPSSYDRAGWYARGARPGAVGPAVIAGHVDSRTGPAIFFDLDRVRPGDDIEVTDSRGTVFHFVVDDIARYVKRKFPTQAVYGPTPLPVLRLITCTGAFDRAKRSYVDNLVVSARLRQSRAG